MLVNSLSLVIFKMLNFGEFLKSYFKIYLYTNLEVFLEWKFDSSANQLNRNFVFIGMSYTFVHLYCYKRMKIDGLGYEKFFSKKNSNFEIIF